MRSTYFPKTFISGANLYLSSLDQQDNKIIFFFLKEKYQGVIGLLPFCHFVVVSLINSKISK